MTPSGAVADTIRPGATWRMAWWWRLLTSHESASLRRSRMSLESMRVLVDPDLVRELERLMRRDLEFVRQRARHLRRDILHERATVRDVQHLDARGRSQGWGARAGVPEPRVRARSRRGPVRAVNRRDAASRRT